MNMENFTPRKSCSMWNKKSHLFYLWIRLRETALKIGHTFFLLLCSHVINKQQPKSGLIQVQALMQSWSKHHVSADSCTYDTL